MQKGKNKIEKQATKSKLTSEQWTTVKAKYLAGAGLTELADKYHIGKSAISQKAKRQGWGKHASLRKEIDDKAIEKVKGELIETRRLSENRQQPRANII